MRRDRLRAMGTLFVLLAVAPLAAADDTLELRNAVFQEVERTDAAGKTLLERVPASKVVPGTEVIYVITYRNTGAQPAGDVVITNPVPAELAYHADRSTGPGIQVSVDGGKSYGALSALSVKGPDGRLRTAQVSDVTHLRWRLGEPVRPGEEGSVSYRAVLE